MEASEEIKFLGILLPFTLTIFIIAVGVVFLHQQFRKNLLKQRLVQEELKILHQKELLKTTIQVQEEERQRIARDLHDELAALLSINRMRIVQLEMQLPGVDDLQQIRMLTENALASVRRISHELIPVQLSHLGLSRALITLMEQAQIAAKWEIEIKIEKEVENFAWPVKLGLYRIFAELINNSLKHAKAGFVSLSLSVENGKIVGEYSDDGNGIPQEVQLKGLGMKSLEGRVSALNGQWQVLTTDGKGFKAQFRIPSSE